jgi:hypothetical protein
LTAAPWLNPTQGAIVGEFKEIGSRSGGLLLNPDQDPRQILLQKFFSFKNTSFMKNFQEIETVSSETCFLSLGGRGAFRLF